MTREVKVGACNSSEASHNYSHFRGKNFILELSSYLKYNPVTWGGGRGVVGPGDTMEGWVSCCWCVEWIGHVRKKGHTCLFLFSLRVFIL
jgi:hypothetical protein